MHYVLVIEHLITRAYDNSFPSLQFLRYVTINPLLENFLKTNILNITNALRLCVRVAKAREIVYKKTYKQLKWFSWMDQNL